MTGRVRRAGEAAAEVSLVSPPADDEVARAGTGPGAAAGVFADVAAPLDPRRSRWARGAFGGLLAAGGGFD